jgi:lysozyme
MLHGTDISAYQPSSVPAGDFVIIKATEGLTYVSSEFTAQMADAKRKGMLRGTYHFPDYANDPLAEARHFCNVVGPFLASGDKVVLDHEASSPPSAAHASAWGLKWLAYVEAQLKRRPWVYANLDWAMNGYCAGMGGYPYWCADPSSPAGKPRVRGPFKTWVAHQYDISGIDLDVFNGTRADWLGSPTPTPATEEDSWFLGTSS